MGFFGLSAGHTDDGDDEAGLTCMISNSRIPDNYEPGRFHLFGSGMYTVVKPKSISIFSGLGRHGGTPPIAPDGVVVSQDATRLMMVFYCPKVALSPAGTSMPLASLPNGTPLLLGPEVTNPLYDPIFLCSFISFQFICIYHSGARETEFTGHSVWSHDAHIVMEEESHLNLMTMGLLQTCSYVTEQMQSKVTIDVNKFLEAFSIEVDGSRIHPPSWTQSAQDSASFRPHAQIQRGSTSNPSSASTNVFDMDSYRTSRQAEAIRWINLQEKRSSIIARLQPTTAEEYQLLRDAVTSDHGPLRRTYKKKTGMKGTEAKFHRSPCIIYLYHSNQMDNPNSAQCNKQQRTKSARNPI